MEGMLIPKAVEGGVCRTCLKQYLSGEGSKLADPAWKHRSIVKALLAYGAGPAHLSSHAWDNQSCNKPVQHWTTALDTDYILP